MNPDPERCQERITAMRELAASVGLPNVITSGRTLVPDRERNRVFQQSGPNDWGSYPGSSVPVSPTLALVGFIGLCLLVGIVGGSMTARAIHHWYQTLHMPPGTPPNWVFAPVWTTLYVMIGVAGWLVWKHLGASPPLRLWGWQLAANAVWAPAFFGVHSTALAMGVMVVLLVLIALTIRSFRRVHRTATMLMLPYGAWCLYAAYLNAGFLILNHT
jgi:translocator protein